VTKIPEYKLYSGTDNLKYTRGTTRIDKPPSPDKMKFALPSQSLNACHVLP